MFKGLFCRIGLHCYHRKLFEMRASKFCKLSKVRWDLNRCCHCLKEAWHKSIYL